MTRPKQAPELLLCAEHGVFAVTVSERVAAAWGTDHFLRDLLRTWYQANGLRISAEELVVLESFELSATSQRRWPEMVQAAKDFVSPSCEAVSPEVRPDTVVTVQEVAERLKRSPQMVRRQCADGTLSPPFRTCPTEHKPGTAWLIYEEVA